MFDDQTKTTVHIYIVMSLSIKLNLREQKLLTFYRDKNIKHA